MQNDAPIRLGIIGAGHMTMKRHLPALARLSARGKCELKAICDIDYASARDASNKYHIPFVTHDSSELIKRADIDAVCIFGPADVHYEYGLMALNSGKHLFVEKPPAQNYIQLGEMYTTAKMRGRIAVAGFNRRFQKSFSEINKRIGSGSILTAEAVFHKPNASMPAPFGMRTWLGANSIHAIDALCFVMGERPTALYASANGGDAEVPENFSVLFEWDNRHAVLSANNSAGLREERYAFHGTGISFICEENSLRICKSGEVKNEVIGGESGAHGGIEEEFDAFFTAIVSGIQPIHALNRVISSMYLVELIENGYRGPIDWSVNVGLEFATTTAVTENKTNERRHKRRRGSVLVLNPSAMRSELPPIAKDFSIVYEEELTAFSDEMRARIVAVITGGPGGRPLLAEHLA